MNVEPTSLLEMTEKGSVMMNDMMVASSSAPSIMEHEKNPGADAGRALSSPRKTFVAKEAAPLGARKRTKMVSEARDSLLEQLERNTMPAAEIAEVIPGMRNIVLLLLGVAFLKDPLFRAMRGISPVNLELLTWMLGGFGTTVGLFVLVSLGTLCSYLLHLLCIKNFISVPTREALHRVALFVHILLSGRLIQQTTLSPVPSFALSCQTLCVFMKMHSYFAETRKKLDENAQLNTGSVKPEELVKWRDYLYFVVAPTLVYKPDGYPRTEKFRIGFFVRKSFAVLGLLLTMYLIATESILQILPRVNEMRWYEFLWSLILPCSAFFVASFIVMFEAILNLLAEATRFADRQFYQDWWNSSSLDEFSRKWNRPVHEWLDHHVYRACISEVAAMGLTFVFSALFHEWVLALTFRRARMYLFVMMMGQIPIIIVPKRRFKRSPWKDVANVLLWFTFFIGLGVLCGCYANEWYQGNNLFETEGSTP